MKVKIIQVPVAGNDAETVVNKALSTIKGTITNVERFTDDRIGVFYNELTGDQDSTTDNTTGGGTDDTTATGDDDVDDKF